MKKPALKFFVVAIFGVLLGFAFGKSDLPLISIFVGGIYGVLSVFWIRRQGPSKSVQVPEERSQETHNKKLEVVSSIQPEITRNSLFEDIKRKVEVDRLATYESFPKHENSNEVFPISKSWIQFIAYEKNSRPYSDLTDLFDMIAKLDDVKGHRLIITQFRTETRLVDPLEGVLREKRPIADAILKGIYKNTDLIPFGKLSSSVSVSAMLQVLLRHYSQVILFAPSSERDQWLSIYSVPLDSLVEEGLRASTPQQA